MTTNDGATMAGVAGALLLASVAAAGVLPARRTAGDPPASRAAAAAAAKADESFRFAPFGLVRVYVPSGPPSQVVLFVSGDGGWELGVIPMAERLRAEGALVVGIDVRSFFAGLEQSRSCAYPAGSLEELSRAVQLRHHLPEYRAPILVGYSSGATLVYAAVAQAPPETFRGAVSLGFCSDVPLAKRLCRGRGLVSRRLPQPRGARKPPGWDLSPFPELAVPWAVLQGEIDQVCAPSDTARFVEQVRSGRLVRLPKVGHGFAVTQRWEPQYVDAYRRIASGPPSAAPVGSVPTTGTGTDELGLGIVEVPASGPQGDLMAVLLTGDGGWAGIDKHLAGALAADGVPVAGWSSLRYYWTPRTPDAAAQDLARVVEHYLRAWGKQRVLLVGYSFGADVLPYLANRLPSGLRSRVALLALIGLSSEASFEFHVTDWLGLDSGHHPTVPEIERLASTPVLCVRGDDEDDSPCGSLRSPGVRVVTLPGGHHFDGDYARVAQTLLAALPGHVAGRP